MANPATEKRGGNPDMKHKPEHQKPKDAMERKLEQGLEESWRVPTPSVSLSRQRPCTKRKRTKAYKVTDQCPLSRVLNGTMSTMRPRDVAA